MGKPAVGIGLLFALFATWPHALSAGPGPRLPQPPPPPPFPSAEGAPPEAPGAEGMQEGQVVRVNGLPQQALWRWAGATDGRPRQLWVPLEVLQGQLGFSSRSRVDGALELEWFGRRQVVPTAGQISLADEVAIDVEPFLAPDGLSASVERGELQLRVRLPLLRQSRSRW